jgi:hypothetical protein
MNNGHRLIAHWTDPATPKMHATNIADWTQLTDRNLLLVIYIWSSSSMNFPRYTQPRINQENEGHHWNSLRPGQLVRASIMHTCTVRVKFTNLLDFTYTWWSTKQIWDRDQRRARSSSWSPPCRSIQMMKLSPPKRLYYSHSIKSNQPYR